MDEFPGVVYRSGPAGRRPGLVGGLDVWEVVSIHRGLRSEERTAEWLSISPSAVGAALRFYAKHQDEVDQWIRRNDDELAAAERIIRAREAAGS